MRQFEVWWADLEEPVGRRPVLLLTRNSGYSYLNKFLAVEITSTIREIGSEVRLGKEEGMLRDCVANCDNLRMVAKDSFTNQAGSLAPRRWIEVKKALGQALGWRELTDLP